MVWDFNSVALGYGGAMIVTGIVFCCTIIYDESTSPKYGPEWITESGKRAFWICGAIIGFVGFVITTCAVWQVF